ncbi:rare lipoprotein a [Actinoplanes sp. N902-109]|nr:rare lipoprotein a [Actinoplanes sp. N902-109]
MLGITLLLQHSGGACAAPPTSAKHRGKATFYDLAGTQGNCSFDPPADDLYVALGVDEYADATSCGSYLDVTGPRGTVRVKVFDKCPECTPGWLDLSRTAFRRIAPESDGIVPITYRAVPNAPTPAPLTITFMPGASSYWWAVIIDNHANPIASVRAKAPGGAWMTATHEDYNAWLINRRTGPGPFRIAMTDTYGHTATATAISLTPGKRQQSTARFAPTPPPKPKRSPSRSPSASPSPSASTSSPSPAPSSTTVPWTQSPAARSDLALAAGAPHSGCQ